MRLDPLGRTELRQDLQIAYQNLLIGLDFKKKLLELVKLMMHFGHLLFLLGSPINQVVARTQNVIF